MHSGSVSYSVRGLVSHWSTAVMSLPVKEWFCKDHMGKKKSYWPLSFPLYTLEKRISTLTVRLVVQTPFSNTSTAPSSSIPHSKISPCCNSLRCKHSEESGYFPSPSVLTKLAIYFKGCKTKFRPWRMHIPCTLNTFMKDFFLCTLIQKKFINRMPVLLQNFLHISGCFE